MPFRNVIRLIIAVTALTTLAIAVSMFMREAMFGPQAIWRVHRWSRRRL